MKKHFSVLCLTLLLSFATFAQEKKLTVLYTNDLHSHFEPQIVPWADKTRLIGGFANIATLVKREKKANPNTVYFDAGDFLRVRMSVRWPRGKR